MTEKEKMLANQWYDANYDDELHRDLIKAKDLCFDYNQTRPSDENERQKILANLLGYQPDALTIMQPFNADYGWNIKVGSNVYMNSNCYLIDCARIEIGNNVFIGPSCGFYTAHHPLTYKERNQGLEIAHPIKIGDNVWFGGNVVVTPGVTIGEGSVIGAGSVVSKDIPPNSLAVGNPCKVIRQIEND